MARVLTGWSLLLAAIVAVLLAPATGHAQVEVVPDGALVASLVETGNVNLVYRAPVGTTVYFYERVGGSLKALSTKKLILPPFPAAVLLHAARWRCDRLVRRFEAVAIAANGARSQASYDVRTPSCAERLQLSVPSRVAVGAIARVRVSDAWKSGGIRPRLCIAPPRARLACRALAFPRSVDIAARQFRASRRGVWRVQLRFGGRTVRRAVVVGVHTHARTQLPTVLATGGSMMQGLDSYLGDRLQDTATVRSDVRPATGVSRGLEWLSRPAAQVKRYRPTTTVIMMADLGYTMRTPAGATRVCCDALWAAEYTRRARLMMKTYIRNGRGHVLWLLMPTPRSPAFADVMKVVNPAVVRAAAGLKGAWVLPTDLLFAPSGFREFMPYRGQNVRVRQTDGVHFTATGASIAAEAVERALRLAPGWLGPGHH